MKKAIIYYKDSDNIGDDIQTYAALQLLGSTDYFLDREALNKNVAPSGTHLLCNGWFMKNPQNWPPHPYLKPLFISMYIDHKHGCHNYMLNKELISYYKQYGPIGCRDKHTLKLFKDLGVPAYFSGCVTLTLPPYKDEKSDEILFVDPFVKIFDQKYVDTQIKRMIPEGYKDQVSILTHHNFNLRNLSIAQRMEKAQKLLVRYAQAKLIITSRIHCALPATALGTPVYFIDVGYDRKFAHARLEGLLDLFEVIDNQDFAAGSNQPWTKLRRKLGLYPKDKITPNPIDFNLTTDSRNKFDANFIKARNLADNIKEITHNFFDL